MKTTFDFCCIAGCALLISVLAPSALRAAPSIEFVPQSGHARAVFGLAVTRDGRLMASASADDTIRIWHAPSGRLIRTIEGFSQGAGFKEGGWPAYFSLSFSTDGQHLLARRNLPDAAGHLWFIFSVVDGRLVRQRQEGGVSYGVSLVGQDRYFHVSRVGVEEDDVTRCDEAEIRDIRTNQLIERMPLPGVRAAALDSTGMELALLLADEVRLVHPSSGALLQRLRVEDRRAFNIAYDSNGAHIILTYDTPAGILQSAIRRSEGPLRDLGEFLHPAVVHSDGRLVVAPQGIGLPQQRIIGLFAPQSNSRDPARTLEGHSGDLGAMTFLPGERHLVSAAADASIRFWNVDTGRPWRLLGRRSEDLGAMSMSPDGSSFAVTTHGGSGDGEVAAHENNVQVWDLVEGKLRHLLTGHEGPVLALAYSPKGDLIATASADKKIGLWDARTGRSLAFLRGHRSQVRTVAFSSDGGLLAAGADDGPVRVWNVTTRNLIRSLWGHRELVQATAFTGDGKGLWSSSGSAFILWNVGTGNIVRREDLDYKAAAAVKRPIFWRFGRFSLNRDESVFAMSFEHSSGQLRTVLLCDARSLEVKATLNTDAAGAVFSPDGAHLVTADYLGALRIWALNSVVASGSAPRELKDSDSIATLPGHIGGTRGIAFTADGRRLISVGADSTIRVWDFHRRTLLSTFRPVGGESAITATADGYYRLVGGGAMQAIAFRRGMQAYGFDQFDLRFNRPDLVLASLNSSAEIAKDASLRQKIARYKAYWEYRVKQNGFKPEDISGQKEIHAPEVTHIAIDGLPRDPPRLGPGRYGPGAPSETRKRQIALSFKIQDEASSGLPVIGYRIFVNGVPLDGQYIKREKPTKVLSIKRRVTLSAHGSRPADAQGIGELSQGENHIEISGMTSDGVESNRESVYIRYIGSDLKKKPSLYVITLGIDAYSSGSGFQNLNLAVKDARDLAGLLANQRGAYGRIVRQTFANAQVNRARIQELARLLRKTSVDDTVIVFLSGHGYRALTPTREANGMLELSYGNSRPPTLRYTSPANIFYYMTGDSSAKAPWEKAVPLDMIRMMLDGIPARQKVLMIDACNSGEDTTSVGSEPSQFAQEEAGKQLALLDKSDPERSRSWTRGEGDARGVKLRIAASIDQREMAELFPELRRGNGTIEISAATASQSAYEDARWGNGAFTYALKQGLAKTRKDGRVYAGALRKYVFESVGPLTGGRQQPMVARDLAGRDFVLVQAGR